MIKAPPIKCQGIKTKLVPWIKAVLPDEFNGRWIEPFMGSCVVALNLRPQNAYLADSNPHLVNFYNGISSGEITADGVRQFLIEEGNLLCDTEGEHFYAVRERFNETGNPIDFLFLNRSCFNGMIRFNRKGGFNVPFCRKPDRFRQAYVTKITNQVRFVSDVLEASNLEFHNQGYEETISQANDGDIIYCDPPYIGRHADYFNGWSDSDERRLYELLSASPSRFILSTWHSNQYRRNEYIDEVWGDFNIITREHFYHVGGKEANRNAMTEALITNFEVEELEQVDVDAEQMEMI